MPAAQTMIGDREQAICVGGQVHPNYICFFVDDVIDESWILMSEAVVVLPPNMRSAEISKRRDRPPPLDIARDLQPLGMLIKHRIHDVDEGFVTRKKSVPSGEKVSFQPAL